MILYEFLLYLLLLEHYLALLFLLLTDLVLQLIDNILEQDSIFSKLIVTLLIFSLLSFYLFGAGLVLLHFLNQLGLSKDLFLLLFDQSVIIFLHFSYLVH